MVYDKGNKENSGVVCVCVWEGRERNTTVSYDIVTFYLHVQTTKITGYGSVWLW